MALRRYPTLHPLYVAGEIALVGCCFQIEFDSRKDRFALARFLLDKIEHGKHKLDSA
jgi:hypothetical protein